MAATHFRDSGFNVALCLLASMIGVLLLSADSPRVNASVAKVHLLTAGDHHETLTRGGILRSYIIHVPSGRSVPGRPLILVYPGSGETAVGAIASTDFERVADRVGDVVVFMQGYRSSWDELAGTTYAVKAHIDDVGFTRAVLKALIPLTAYDAKRVALAGFSNGAEMVQTLGCRVAAIIRLIVPIEGEMLSAISPSCAPSRSISVYEIHGTADGTIPYQGGVFEGDNGLVSVLSASATVARWASLDGCGSLPDLSSSPGFTLKQYRGCSSQVSVTLRTIVGGTHTWGGDVGTLVVRALGR